MTRTRSYTSRANPKGLGYAALGGYLATARRYAANETIRVGLYGPMAYSVTRTTYKIGIRLASGAKRRQILRMVLRSAAVLVLMGVVIVLPGALAATRLISSQLYDLKPIDLPKVSLAMVFLFVAAALAAYLPARRASRVDPRVGLPDGFSPDSTLLLNLSALYQHTFRTPPGTIGR
jgi:hypothetical protein